MICNLTVNNTKIENVITNISTQASKVRKLLLIKNNHQMNPQSQLSAAITDKIRISDVEMIGIDLINAVLSYLQADRLNLSSANMMGATLCSARFGQCLLESAKFEGADFSNAVLHMCIFDAGQGTGACFNNARIEDSTAKGINLKAAELRGAKLSETSFERAVLQDAVLDGAEGDGIVFRGADLHGASLVNVLFNDTDFRGADLRGANLTKGCFKDADFRGALLQGTIFEDADCSGAIFDLNEGPNATGNDKEKTEKNEEATTSMIASLLKDSLAKLPAEIAGNSEFLQNMTERIQQMGETFTATAKYSPEEWKEWTESFLALTKDNETANLETIIEALDKGPIKFQNPSLLSSVSKDEMLDRLRALNKMLNAGGNEPPEEWKPIIEPLMKKIKAGEGVDFKTIMGLFANWPKDISAK